MKEGQGSRMSVGKGLSLQSTLRMLWTFNMPTRGLRSIPRSALLSWPDTIGRAAQRKARPRQVCVLRETDYLWQVLGLMAPARPCQILSIGACVNATMCARDDMRGRPCLLDQGLSLDAAKQTACLAKVFRVARNDETSKNTFEQISWPFSYNP